MNRTIVLLAVLLATFLTACQESERYVARSDDKTPPSAPIFIDSRPLPGGAVVYFLPPDDEDLLEVDATFSNSAGKRLTWSASYFVDSVKVFGFSEEGEHSIELYAMDRAGNKSKSISAKVECREPNYVSVAKTIKATPSFGSVLLGWEDTSEENVYVYANLKYGTGEDTHNYTTVFSTISSETRSIDSLKAGSDVPIDILVSVGDKYNNRIDALHSTLHLHTDSEIDKSTWILPAYGTEIGGAVQAFGSYDQGVMEAVIDGITEADGSINFYKTNAVNPWNIIIDLGAEYKLSRIRTHQRYTGDNSTDVKGTYYGGDNVLSYNMYIWDSGKSEWVFCSRHDIPTPVVKQELDYKIYGDKGDEAFIYPLAPGFSEPTRFFRFEAIGGKYISEITLFGEMAI